MTDLTPSPEVRAAIEAVLLAAVEPVEPQLLAQLLEMPVADVEATCDAMIEAYEQEGRGFTVARVAGAQVLTHLVQHSSAIYGSIGTFFALLLWMLVIGYILTVAAFVEVTAWTRRRGTVTREIQVPAPD